MRHVFQHVTLLTSRSHCVRRHLFEPLEQLIPGSSLGYWHPLMARIRGASTSSSTSSRVAIGAVRTRPRRTRDLAVCVHGCVQQAHVALVASHTERFQLLHHLARKTARQSARSAGAQCSTRHRRQSRTPRVPCAPLGCVTSSRACRCVFARSRHPTLQSRSRGPPAATPQLGTCDRQACVSATSCSSHRHGSDPWTHCWRACRRLAVSRSKSSTATSTVIFTTFVASLSASPHNCTRQGGTHGDVNARRRRGSHGNRVLWHVPYLRVA